LSNRARIPITIKTSAKLNVAINGVSIKYISEGL
jgi:hypothetical protein